MSLRLKLILAFTALVSLILLVGIVSLVINDRVRTDVAGLRSSHVPDLRRIDLDQVGLEIEGYWNPGGSFVATGVEVLPKLAFPKLRGAIQNMDERARTITLYGVAIRMLDDTRSSDVEGQVVRFEDLRPEQRVEVTCEIEHDVWKALKVKLRDVKASDKIKGTVTSAKLDGEAPKTLEMHGLLILLEPSIHVSAMGAMGHIERATQMSLALQECRAAARALVGKTHARSPSPADPDLGSRIPPALSAGDRLVRAAEDFGFLVLQSQEEEREDPARSSPSPIALGWLRLLTEKQESLDGHVRALNRMVADEPARAAKYQDDVFEPYLDEELLPLVQNYLGQGKEELGEQLRGVLARTSTTARVALAMSGLAVIVALVLGFLFWRSIERPIRVLHAAALRLGRGHLDTRVHLSSRDEIGVLADAFNKMAGELATTTISTKNLESIFDSMAGALILLDPQERITNVNRAALDLVGYEREALLGRSFDVVCKRPEGPPGELIMKPREDGTVPIAQRVFVRRDGSEVSVSFSGAEVRSHGGPLQGFVCVAQDLTEQKEIEARIRGSLAEKEVLIREVHHRVKNNMQVISSLLAMQSGCTSDATTVEKLEQSQNRIQSIALIHEQLFQAKELADIDMRAYLEMLTSHLVRSFAKADRIDVELRVDDVNMNIDESLACGLIVNELVTNALKHAFPGGRRGLIRVSLSEDASGDHVLAVSDDGVGIGESDPAGSQTMGVSLVRNLARQLRGRVEFSGEGGTGVRIAFPRSSAEVRS